MSALAGPGDLAASLGEMAKEQSHLLSVWDAGMLAVTSLARRLSHGPELSYSMGICHLPPASGARAARILFPLAESHLGAVTPEKGCLSGQPPSAWKEGCIQARMGVPLALVLCVAWSGWCVCDRDPRGGCWVNITLWLKDCKQRQ